MAMMRALEDTPQCIADVLLIVDDHYVVHAPSSKVSGWGADGSGAPAIGKKTRNVESAPAMVSTSIVALKASTIPCTTDRPSPVPRPTLRVVKNGSKMRSAVAESMPWRYGPSTRYPSARNFA